jgi:orotate phosphoribosyltransferase
MEGRAALDLSRPARVLVVDDSVLSGTQLERTRRRIAEARLPHELRFAAVYATAGSAAKVDFHFELCELPRMFQWNFMHHARLDSACVDIDGVLCRDPLEHENDDGPNYERFLATAQPLHLPTARIRWLVTCRLEKYRAQTERWLSQHGVAYDELVMWDLPSKTARVAAGSHGAFKGRFYRGCGAKLFIESSRRQASEIADVSGKSVLCVEGMQMIEPSMPVALGAAALASARRFATRVQRKCDSLRHRLVMLSGR